MAPTTLEVQKMMYFLKAAILSIWVIRFLAPALAKSQLSTVDVPWYELLAIYFVFVSFLIPSDRPGGVNCSKMRRTRDHNYISCP